jgi:hypothetical protein
MPKWFTAKDAPSKEPVRGKTISDAEWQTLKDRQKGLPEITMREAGRRMKHTEDNYHNRHRN